jgi:gliding motility-associated-like protein
MLKVRLCVSLFLLSLSIDAQVITNGLVAWYPFNGNANDESGNGLNGVNFGASFVADRFGDPAAAAFFDGLSDYIQISHNNAFNFGPNEDFTISLWVKADNIQPSPFNNFDVISKWEDNPGGANDSYPWALRIRNASFGGTMRILRYDQPCNNFPFDNGTTNLLDDTYYHIVYRKSGSNLELFVNGQLEKSFTDIASCNTANQLPVYIGKRGGTFNPTHYKGIIDDIGIYNRALSLCEINQLYTLDLSGGLVAHYPLDGNALDVSGNNHHGTNQGATFTSDRNNNPSSAARFDGVDDFISCGNILNIANQSGMSISAWFYPEPPVNSQVNRYAGVSFGTKLDGELMLRTRRDDIRGFQAMIASGSPLSADGNSSSALTGNHNYSEWYHVVGTYEDQKVRIYLNGQFVSENSGIIGTGGVLSHIQSNANLWIATAFNTFNDQKFYRGRTDDIRVYNRVINDCEILALYDTELLASNPGCCFLPGDSITDPIDPDPTDPDPGDPDTLVPEPQRPQINLFIPNVISPNGDGYNDFFVIEDLDKYPLNELVIYNRYGREVFSQVGYENGWNGNDLPAGVYFYRLVLYKESINFKGFIHLMR